MASTIGIKLADGEFYSILDEQSSTKKRLVLTTVHDNQRSVQIDLYKSAARTMTDALYIGSLVVEDLSPKPSGEPSIELVISLNEEGELNADARELDNSRGGEHQYLHVSLKSLDEESRDFEIPDFELERPEPPPEGLYQKAEKVREDRGKFPWAFLVCLGIVLIGVCLLLWFFLFRERIKTRSETAPPPVAVETAPPPPAQATPPPPPPEPAPAPAPEPPKPAAAAPPPPPAPPVIRAPAAPAAKPATQKPTARRRNPPVASYKVPAVIPKNGAPYKIRWGDTLWDISEAFYRNPWLYRRIARFNNIRNPDLIISGRVIRIPPRN